MPINVTIARPDNITVNGVTVTNIPGGNSRGTQRPDLVPGVDPYLNGRRPLAEPGGVHDAAAGHVRQPAAQLPARAGVRAGRPDGQQGLPLRQSQGFQFRVEMFNILNRLNYENPATTLPNGTPGVPFTDAQAGTFGYMLGPLNRTVGLGTARQTQLSLRYTF